MKNFLDFIMDLVYRFAKLLILIIILLLTTFLVYVSVQNMFTKNYTQQSTYDKDLKIKQVYDEKTDIEVSIPAEAKNLDVSKILISGNIISNEEDFLNYLKSKNIKEFKSGNFKLNKKMTPEQIVNIIKK